MDKPTQNESDFSSLPDKLRCGLDEYLRLWNAGLKKQANAVLTDTMQHFDSLPEEVRLTFAGIICRDGNTYFGGSHLPYQVSVHLHALLKPYAESGTLPQARWYCERFGDFTEKLSVYQKNSDDLRLAELLMNEIVNQLFYGTHHFPSYSCIKPDEAAALGELGREILVRHEISPPLKNEFLYYIKLHELFLSWDKSRTFPDHCRENGLDFDEVPAYYYS